MSLFTYSALWTDFEIQSLTFSILRKNLYPHYLVRGNYKFPKGRVDIAIFKATQDKTKPELRLVIEINTNSRFEVDQDKYMEILGVPTVFIRTGKTAYDILNLVRKHL